MQMRFSESPLADSDMSDEKNECYIYVASIDGDIHKLGLGLCPSWSPKENRIAYGSSAVVSSKVSETEYVNVAQTVLWSCNPDGNNRTALTTAALPSDKAALRFKSVFKAALCETFKTQYGEKLTAEQMDKLEKGELTKDEMTEIAKLISSEEIQIDLTSQMATHGTAGQESTNVSQAYYLNALMESMSAFVYLWRMDLTPVWSTDGSRIAFVRGLLPESCDNQLVVMDVATGEEKVLADHARINCLTWSKNGTKIAAEIVRPTSLQDKPGEMMPDLKSGCPEVWLLEPK
jgi:hypothetical protein